MPNVGSNDHIAITEDGVIGGVSYMKFSNGKMICYGTITTPAISTAEGSLFVSSSTTAVFPFPFISIPSVTGVAANLANVVGIRGGSTLTGFTLVGIASASIAGVVVSWQAVGSWF